MKIVQESVCAYRASRIPASFVLAFALSGPSSAQVVDDAGLAKAWNISKPLHICTASIQDFGARCNGNAGVPLFDQEVFPIGSVPAQGWCAAGENFCGYDIDVWRCGLPSWMRASASLGHNCPVQEQSTPQGSPPWHTSFYTADSLVFIYILLTCDTTSSHAVSMYNTASTPPLLQPCMFSSLVSVLSPTHYAEIHVRAINMMHLGDRPCILLRNSSERQLIQRTL